MKKYLFLLLFIVSCKQNAKHFETKDWFDANLTLSSKKLFKSEHLQIKVNDKLIYSVSGDTSQSAIYKLFKIPNDINEIKVTSKMDGRTILDKSYAVTYKAIRYQIIISPPYPRNLKNRPFPFESQWFHLPIDSIKRDITIKPDTSKNNIIL